jgi:hypothetical protein
MDSLELSAQSEREQRIGKRTLLVQQQTNIRIHIDAIIRSVRQDHLGIRDAENRYVETIDYTKAIFLLREASKKRKELETINKEIAALNAALGNDGNE